MNFAVHKTNNQQKLMFQFQSIVDGNGAAQNWIEMFYRPKHFSGQKNIEQFFKSLTPQSKVDLDTQIFNQLPNILNSINPSRLSINVMPNSLLNTEFRNNLRLLIDENTIDVSKVCIEIVEIHSMSPINSESLDLLKYFKSKGGLIALDDFGSGFAHWELLQTGLIDIVKVANQNFKPSQQIQSFTQALSVFSQSMGIRTVLEGVESQQDYELGLEQGYHNFQGWYFDKSFPINGFES